MADTQPLVELVTNGSHDTKKRDDADCELIIAEIVAQQFKCFVESRDFP